jgi:predicted esterase
VTEAVNGDAWLRQPLSPIEPSERSRSPRGSSVVVDLQWTELDGEPTDGYLVLPAANGPCPGILYFHWLEPESPTANRSEFVDEAIGLADDGVASLHVQGRFPWRVRPSGAEADRERLIAQVRELRRALELLARRPDVDPSRITLVGHDFGAMYGAVLAARDPRLKGLAMLAAVPAFADWFVPYWRGVLGDLTEAQYRARLADLDPVAALPRVAPRPILLQFANDDPYVNADASAALTTAAGPAARRVDYDAGHALDIEAARIDRVAWLRGLLLV